MYFDKKADTYHADTQKFPWSIVRGKEQRAVESLLGDIGGAHFLDLGCGAGFYTRLALSKGVETVVAVDQSAAMISMLPQDERVVPVTANVADLSLSLKFSHVVCAGLLEFVDDAGIVFKIVAEMADSDTLFVVLAPPDTLGGQLYKFFHFSHNVNINLFGDEALVALARNKGWKLVEKSEPHCFANVFLFRRDS